MELAELHDLQSRRTTQIETTVRFWDDPTIIMPWSDLALDLIKTHRLSSLRAGRVLALLHTALFDTLLATADARRYADRPHPTVADPDVLPLGTLSPRRGSFPSEHAAVAAAAATVLTYLFPAASALDLTAMADEAAMSRLWAGQAVRSDLEAGQAIGHTVGHLAAAHGLNDQSTLTWDGARPAPGDGVWEPTPPDYDNPPLEPTAGRWRPWVLPDGAAFRPGPPPPYRSPAWRAEVEAVRFTVPAPRPTRRTSGTGVRAQPHPLASGSRSPGT